jgi:hypothetical protein
MEGAVSAAHQIRDTSMGNVSSDFFVLISSQSRPTSVAKRKEGKEGRDVGHCDFEPVQPYIIYVGTSAVPHFCGACLKRFERDRYYRKSFACAQALA